MANFIKLLMTKFKMARRGIETSAIDSELTYQVMLIYNQAWQRCKFHHYDPQQSTEILMEAIAIHLTEEFKKVNWQNRRHRQLIAKAIETWVVGADDPSFHRYQAVQKILIKLLPALNKRERLLNLCYDYKNYFK